MIAAVGRHGARSGLPAAAAAAAGGAVRLRSAATTRGRAARARRGRRPAAHHARSRTWAASTSPPSGQLRPHASRTASAVIGETLWIRGSHFGRQPTVSIGGQVGGRRSRAPATAASWCGCRSGTPAGRAAAGGDPGARHRRAPDRRCAGWARCCAADRLVWLELGADGPRVRGRRRRSRAPSTCSCRPTPRGLRRSTAGAACTVFELAAAGRARPRCRKLELGPGRCGRCWRPARPTACWCCARRDLVVLDTSAPLRPVRGDGAAAAGLAARRAACCGRRSRPTAGCWRWRWPERNRVAGASTSIDLRWPGRRRRRSAVAELALVPEVRAPVLVDLAFAPDGRHLVGAVREHRGATGAGPAADHRCTPCGCDGAGAAARDRGLARGARRWCCDGGRAPGGAVDRAQPAADQRRGRPPAAREGDGLRRRPHARRASGPALFAVGAEDTRHRAVHRGRRGARSAAPTSPPTAAGCWAPVVEGAGDVRLAVGPGRRPPGRPRSLGGGRRPRRRPRRRADAAGGGEAAAVTAAAGPPACARWCGAACRGSGFRASAQHEAPRLGLAGWVRNLSDGAVELEAEGDRTGARAAAGLPAQRARAWRASTASRRSGCAGRPARPRSR